MLFNNSLLHYNKQYCHKVKNNIKNQRKINSFYKKVRNVKTFAKPAKRKPKHMTLRSYKTSQHFAGSFCWLSTRTWPKQ